MPLSIWLLFNFFNINFESLLGVPCNIIKKVTITYTNMFRKIQPPQPQKKLVLIVFERKDTNKVSFRSLYRYCCYNFRKAYFYDYHIL